MYIENAAISLEVVRDALERDGQSVAARTLKGLEVHSPEGAQVALDTLRSLKAERPELADTLALAMSACERATFNTVAAA
jgi:hypothetical protein